MFRLTCCTLLAAALCAPSARAQEQPKERPARIDSARELVWLSASATLLSASLGNMFALRVGSLYERAQLVPGVSPDRLTLKRQTEHAELTADCLFVGALGLLVSTVVLIGLGDWSTPPSAAERTRTARLRVLPTASGTSAGLVLRGELP
jgi:hypothetical protein